MKRLLLLVATFATLIQCNSGSLVNKQDEPATTSPPEETFHLVSTGLSHLFWSHVASPNFTSSDNLTSACRSSLTTVATELSKENDLLLNFINLPGKRVIRSSPSTQDQCLHIFGTKKGASITTKYCVVDLFPVKVGLSDDEEWTRKKITFDRVSHLNRAASMHSLCIPSHCSQSELKQIISAALEPHRLKTPVLINCDSTETTLIVREFESLNSNNLTPLLITLIIFSAMVVCLVMHVHEKYAAALANKTASLSTIVTTSDWDCPVRDLIDE